MPTAKYAVQVDWDDDGDFDELSEDLSQDVIAAEWALGLDDGADSVASPSWAEVTLRDPQRHYTPENADGPLYGDLVPRKKARITSTYGGTTRVHFTGWTESFTPRPDRTTHIRFNGVEDLLQRAEVFLPLGIDQSADETIAATLDQVAYPPALSGYWILCTARLGTDTRLPDVTTYSALESGISRFAYVSDNWSAEPGSDAASAWAVIRAVTAAERGLCYVDRAGKIIFWNRHHLLKIADSAMTLNERQASFTVPHGADITNRAVITCHPRTVGSNPEILWTLRSTLALPPNGSATIRARFADDSGAQIGGKDVITPVAGTDYSANNRSDGSGADYTTSVSVSMVAAANSAELTFSNGAATTVYVLAGAQVRGTKISDYGPTDAEHEDATSITLYGRRTLALNLAIMSDLDDAQRLARYLVLLRKDPAGRVKKVSLRNENSADALAAMLIRTIGNRITLADARSGHNRDYHIIGEQHTLTRGGTEHETIWTLAPASPFVFWRLGITGAGELDQQTRLTY